MVELNVRKPKVYVVNNSGYPYDKAERFGEIIFLTQGSVNHNKINTTIKKMANLLIDSSEDDFLCITGHNFLCSLASLIWAKKHGRVGMLNWNPIKKDYEVYNFMLSDNKTE